MARFTFTEQQAALRSADFPPRNKMSPEQERTFQVVLGTYFLNTDTEVFGYLPKELIHAFLYQMPTEDLDTVIANSTTATSFGELLMGTLLQGRFEGPRLDEAPPIELPGTRAVRSTVRAEDIIWREAPAKNSLAEGIDVQNDDEFGADQTMEPACAGPRFGM